MKNLEELAKEFADSHQTSCTKRNWCLWSFGNGRNQFSI